MCFRMSFSVKHTPLEVFQLVSYCRIAFACRSFQLHGIDNSNLASAAADRAFVLKLAGNEGGRVSLFLQIVLAVATTIAVRGYADMTQQSSKSAGLGFTIGRTRDTVQGYLRPERAGVQQASQLSAPRIRSRQ